MNWRMACAAALVIALSSVAALAQSSGAMGKGDSMAPMNAMETTYTGCLEAGNAAGTFTLTHVAADAHGAMKRDTMAQNSMSKDHHMTPKTLALTGKSVDLSKHVGHRVSVTGTLAHEGMDAMAKDGMKDSMAKDSMAGSTASSFTVKSLKMVAASCQSM